MASISSLRKMPKGFVWGCKQELWNPADTAQQPHMASVSQKIVPRRWKHSSCAVKIWDTVSVKSSHFISPLWMTWGFPWYFWFMSLTHPLGAWGTHWLITDLRMSSHLSLPLLIKSCLSYCNIPALFWLTRPTWQKYIIWCFAPKVPIVSEEFHTLNPFEKQLLFKSNVCKNCIPTLAPLTYF